MFDGPHPLHALVSPPGAHPRLRRLRSLSRTSPQATFQSEGNSSRAYSLKSHPATRNTESPGPVVRNRGARTAAPLFVTHSSTTRIGLPAVSLMKMAIAANAPHRKTRTNAARNLSPRIRAEWGDGVIGALGLTLELSDAGGPARPNCQPT